MNANPVPAPEPITTAPEPTEPAKAATPKPATRKSRTPAKSGDPRADRAAAKKAAAPKPVAKKAATPKAKDETWTKLSTFKDPLTHSQAHVAYRKQRTLLHGAGPQAYRAAAAKALGITDAAFLIAFYPPKADGKPEGK